MSESWATPTLLIALGLWLILRTVTKDDGHGNPPDKKHPQGKPENLVDKILRL